MYANKKLIIDSSNPPEPSEIHWRSPSNIAIIKYWGKHGVQLPRNPSLSLTLAAAFTETLLGFEMKEDNSNELDLKFYFEGEENEAFGAKTRKFLEGLSDTFPFLRQLKLTIQTANSFPHSAGIASSASGMSALALCLCSLEDRLFGTLGDAAAFDQKASYLARLGSGSACRSIFPHASIWGKTSLIAGTSDDWGVAAADYLHPVFKGMHDDILIVSAKEKSVSSRAGHALMDGNPYAEPRYVQARLRMVTLVDAMKAGDVETFGKIAEDEALTLHALMMTSNPSYLLMHANSLKIIEKIREYRRETKNQLYFTLDAGPNVHLLYPTDIVVEARDFIENELRPLCEGGYIINDWVGEGPEEI
jgi:diphosphomevalonate decarboxylase